MPTTRKPRDGHDTHIVLPHLLYGQIARLACEGRRPFTQEVVLALEAYVEQAVRGSQRWHELAGAPSGQEPK